MPPTCRYNHGELRRVEVNGEAASYVMLRAREPSVSTKEGYFVEVWECPECSYLELHDGDRR